MPGRADAHTVAAMTSRSALLPLLAGALALAAPALASGASITSVSPADGRTGVSRVARIAVAFDQPMNAASAQGAFSLAGGASADQPVAGSFSWSGETMTFTPSAPLGAGASYTASEGVAKPAAGDGITTPRVWHFATAVQPVMSGFTPAAGASGVATGAPVTVTFDRAMDAATTQAAFSL